MIKYTINPGKKQTRIKCHMCDRRASFPNPQRHKTTIQVKNINP